MADEGHSTPRASRWEEHSTDNRSMLAASSIAPSTTSLNSSAYQDARETASSSVMYSSASNASTSSVRTAIAEPPNTETSRTATTLIAANLPQSSGHAPTTTEAATESKSIPTPAEEDARSAPTSTPTPAVGQATGTKDAAGSETLPGTAPVEHSSDMAGLQAVGEPKAVAATTQTPQSSSHSAADEEKAAPVVPAPATETLDPATPSGPPSLEYTLRTRKLAIVFFWTLILIDTIAIPLVVYFCLHYLASKRKHTGPLTDNDVFSISTACLGGISIFEYFRRFWRLFRKGSTCRVIGARRMYLDWFHWNFSIAWVFIMAELIIGTTFKHPPIRLLAMPLSSLVYWFSIELMFEDLMRKLHKRAPLRISSVAKGAPMRPGVYSILEDICAVDGSGGTGFRTRLNARYEASHYFRLMLHRLTEFWAIGGLAAATLTTILVFTIHNSEIAYVLGWTVPFVWAGIWTPITFWYVRKCLKTERDAWARGDRGPHLNDETHHV